MKPFQTKGLVRRVTPFMGAGLIALVVFSDPTFSHLAWADALAVVVAGGVIATSLAPIEWDRLPRLGSHFHPGLTRGARRRRGRCGGDRRDLRPALGPSSSLDP